MTPFHQRTEMRKHQASGEGFIAAQATSLYYRSLGSGFPLVVVHGGPGLGHAYLRPGMDVLADKFRLIYYDQRGSGRSAVGNSGRPSTAVSTYQTHGG